MKRGAATILALCAFLFGSILVFSATETAMMLEWFENQTHIIFSVAEEMGFYDEEGLDMTIMSPGMDSAAPIRSLLAGQVQIAYTEPSYFVDMILAGHDLVAFGAFLHSVPHVWYGFAETCAWESPADFAGLRIRDFRDFPQGMWLLKVLDMFGVDPDEDVTFVGGQPGITPLEDGAVDVTEGYIVNEPYAVVAAGHDVGYIHAGSLMDAYGGLLIATREQIEEDPDTYHAFMRANVKAAQFVVENPEAAAEAVTRRVPDLTYDEVYNSLLLMLDTVYLNPDSGVVGDYEISAERLQDTVRWLYFIGYLDEIIDVDEHIVYGFEGR